MGFPLHRDQELVKARGHAKRVRIGEIDKIVPDGPDQIVDHHAIRNAGRMIGDDKDRAGFRDAVGAHRVQIHVQNAADPADRLDPVHVVQGVGHLHRAVITQQLVEKRPDQRP